MPVFQQLIDFNTQITQLSEEPIIINDLANYTEVDRESIKDLITTRYTSDMITLLPSCKCGTTKGEFSVGVTCPTCGSIVSSNVESDIEPIVWFRKPNGVSKLIAPIIWIMLKHRFNKSGFSIMNWLVDKTYRPNVKQPLVLAKLIELGIQRGYNNFVTNFDAIMEILFSIKDFKYKKESEDYLFKLIFENRDKIFSDYIPLPNKSMLIIEKTNVGVYVDDIIVAAIDAIEMLVAIDRKYIDSHVKENRTAKALDKLGDFYVSFYKNNLSPKPGQFRRHIFGTRTNFSFRCVIASRTGWHKYDEIEVPWGVGLTAFQPHMVSKLMNYGMDLNSALGLLLGHIEKYHPLLDKFLQELIDESPEKGIPVILARNPSLLSGSTLKVRIVKFNPDPSNTTISLSILSVSSLNAKQFGLLI